MNFEFIDIIKLEAKYITQMLLWRNKDHVRRMMINDEIISEIAHQNYISKVMKDSSYNIYIGFQDNQPFGVVNIWKIDDSSCEFGYYLINEKDVNSGLGMCMEYFVIDKVFRMENMNNIIARTYEHNRKTINLHSRFGFDTIGIKDNLVNQTLTKEKWKSMHKEIEKLIKFLLGKGRLIL